VPTNIAGSRIDAPMMLGVGNRTVASNLIPQRILYGAFWNVALSAAEITAVFNSGTGGAFDLGNDSGNYSSSANLQHWWRFGHVASDIGGDSGKATVLIDMLQDAVNIDATDIVVDAP